MSITGDRLRKAHREKEQRMVRNALATWTQAEWKAEDLRHPDHERHLIERAEREAEKRPA